MNGRLVTAAFCEGEHTYKTEKGSNDGGQGKREAPKEPSLAEHVWVLVCWLTAASTFIAVNMLTLIGVHAYEAECIHDHVNVGCASCKQAAMKCALCG